MSNLGKLSKLQSPESAARDIAAREKKLRRRQGIMQEELAARAGVSLSSLRRFEQTGQLQFVSLVRLMRALGCDSELDGLFTKPAYRNIQEVIDEQKRR